VAEMAEEPPEPLGPSHRAVGDDEDARPDPRTPGRRLEVVGVGKGMPPALPRRRRELAVDVEEARTRNVAREIELPPAVGTPELPTAIHELVTHLREFGCPAAGLAPNRKPPRAGG